MGSRRGPLSYSSKALLKGGRFTLEREVGSVCVWGGGVDLHWRGKREVCVWGGSIYTGERCVRVWGRVTTGGRGRVGSMVKFYGQGGRSGTASSGIHVDVSMETG